ncbi:hypothetical protein VY88_26245 [Azospirillum thiophilum]|nr:hypothetical protein VY88_26245 [Azospirillum thiophilum]
MPCRGRGLWSRRHQPIALYRRLRPDPRRAAGPGPGRPALAAGDGPPVGGGGGACGRLRHRPHARRLRSAG